jgi:hypothetical protein
VSLRILFLGIIAVLIYRAVRNAARRRFTAGGKRKPEQDLGVDPNEIRDAEFTDVSDREETGK